MSNLRQITTYITQDQYNLLQQHSYKGKKEDKKEDEKTFSEHLREAIKEYNNKL